MGPRQSLGARRVVPPRCAPWPQEPFLAPLVPRWVGALLPNYTLQIDQNSRQAYIDLHPVWPTSTYTG